MKSPAISGKFRLVKYYSIRPEFEETSLDNAFKKISKRRTGTCLCIPVPFTQSISIQCSYSVYFISFFWFALVFHCTSSKHVFMRVVLFFSDVLPLVNPGKKEDSD